MSVTCSEKWEYRSRMGCLRGIVVTPDKAAVCRAQLMGKEGWRWDEMILLWQSIFSAVGGGTHGGKGTRRERREVRRKIAVLLRKDLCARVNVQNTSCIAITWKLQIIAVIYCLFKQQGYCHANFSILKEKKPGEFSLTLSGRELWSYWNIHLGGEWNFCLSG